MSPLPFNQTHRPASYHEEQQHRARPIPGAVTLSDPPGLWVPRTPGEYDGTHFVPAPREVDDSRIDAHLSWLASEGHREVL